MQIETPSKRKVETLSKRTILPRDKCILSRDITFMSHLWLRYTMTAEQVNAATDVFLAAQLLPHKFLPSYSSETLNPLTRQKAG